MVKPSPVWQGCHLAITKFFGNITKKVKCDYETIVWPNGVDICPDVLYKEGKDIPRERKRSKKSVHSKSKKRKLPAK